jgi:hypothetical protein
VPPISTAPITASLLPRCLQQLQIGGLATVLFTLGTWFPATPHLTTYVPTDPTIVRALTLGVMTAAAQVTWAPLPDLSLMRIAVGVFRAGAAPSGGSIASPAMADRIAARRASWVGTGNALICRAPPLLPGHRFVAFPPSACTGNSPP